MKKFLISISVVVCVLVSVLVINNINDASAQTALRPVTGVAWSDGVGWISLNSTNLDGSSNSAVGYGIYADDNGNLTGADGNPGGAWSDTIGWIKFGGLGEGSETFPDGITGRNAYINDGSLIGDQSDDYLDGWVRACSVYVSGCSGTLADPDTTGGWDGWIKLSGSGYQTKINTTLGDSTNTEAKAWGNQILGWIGFEINVPSLVTYQCSDGIDNADPEDNDPPEGDGTKLADQNDPACKPGGVYDGQLDSEVDLVVTDPVVDLKVGPSNNPKLNSFVASKDANAQNIYLGWTVSNADNCTASSIPSSGTWTSSLEIATSTGTHTEGPIGITVDASKTITFKLTCTSASGGESFDEVKVIGAGQKEI